MIVFLLCLVFDIFLLFLGGQVKLTASVSGLPHPTIEWYKDNVQIKASKNVEISSTKSLCSMVLKSSSVKDAGVYACVAKNEAGECRVEATIKVQSSKSKTPSSPNLPTFTTELNDEYLVEEGDEITMGVKFTGKPKPQVKWEKNGSNIISIKRVKIHDGDGMSDLVIKGFRKTDLGNYQCTISNFRGSASCSASVKFG